MKHNHTHTSTGNIRVAFFLNLGFTILEIIGGLWTNSLAILSDALHDFGDSLSLGLAWFLDKYSQKGHDTKYSYGYRRFSLLAALINTVVLIIGSLFILSEAVDRIMNPEHSNAPGMLLFAIAGIVVNGLAVLRVKGGKSLNARVVAWHLLEDVLGWVAVLIVSIVLLFKDVHVLDPILSMLITLYVLFNVIRNLKKTLTLFLQGVPEQIDLNEIERRILAIDRVESLHHTHVWSLDGEHHILTAHVVVDQNTTKDQAAGIKNEIKSQIEEMDFEHVTIEVEYANEDCSME